MHALAMQQLKKHVEEKGADWFSLREETEDSVATEERPHVYGYSLIGDGDIEHKYFSFKTTRDD